MKQDDFGIILRAAREREGYDLTQAARRLRIREDILRAIEEADYAHMPSRGHMRSMIAAYARLVRENPAEITRMYLNGAHTYEQTKNNPAFARQNQRHSNPSASPHSNKNSSRMTLNESERPRRDTQQRSSGRLMYDDRRSRYSENELNSQRNPLSPRSTRQRVSSKGGYSGPQYNNFYSGPRSSQSSQPPLMLILAGAAIVILLIIVLVLLLGNNDKGATSTTENVPITGVTGLTETNEGTQEDTGTSPSEPVAVAPTSVEVEYTISSPDYEEIYATVTTNGSAESLMLQNGTSEIIEVTGTWSLATWVSDAVTITVDGKPVEFNSTDATGMPLCEVDFQTYLEEWNAENGVEPDQNEIASSSNSTNSTVDTNTTTTSSTSGDTQ